MDDEQKQWAATYELMLSISPQRSPPCPANPCRAFCWRLVRDSRFDVAVLGVILFNTMLMGLDEYGIDEERAAVLLSLNMVRGETVYI